MSIHKTWYDLADKNNLEIFHHPDDYNLEPDLDGDKYQEGWYWWSCCLGCLPDGDPIGPFDTEQAALYDAIEPYLWE